MTPAELERLGEVLRQVELERTESPSSVALVRLLLLTGARLGEVLGLRWDRIDWQGGSVRLADSKTGPKTLYLSDAARVVLAGLARPDGNPWCLPGRVHGRPLVNPQKPWRRMRAAAGLDDVRLHDLRHTYASVAARGGLSLPMIGALLGHSRTADDAALCASGGESGATGGRAGGGGDQGGAGGLGAVVVLIVAASLQEGRYHLQVCRQALQAGVNALNSGIEPRMGFDHLDVQRHQMLDLFVMLTQMLIVVHRSSKLSGTSCPQFADNQFKKRPKRKR